MGIVRAAVGLGNMEEELIQNPTPAKLPDPDPGKTTTTTTTTTAKPTDHPDTVYLSGFVVLQVLLLVAFCCFILSAIFIRICKRKYWLSDPTTIIRTYLFKLTTFHLFLSAMCVGLYYAGYHRTGYDENVCFYVWHYRWLLIVMLPMTVVVYALRYMAFGLASSDGFVNKGVQMSNPRTVRTDMKHGWTADNAKYKSILGNFYTFSMLTIGVSLLLLFLGISDEHKTVLKRTSICVPSLSDSILDTVLFLIFMLFSPNFSAILSEFLLREKVDSDLDFFGATLNTPFATTTSATTWLSWYTVLFYLYYFMGAFAGHCVLVLGYLVALDSVWCLLLSALGAITRK